MSELLLGVDIGTSSSKGVLVDDTGGLVAQASRDHRVSMPRAGWFEHDVETVWWEGFTSICSELRSKTRDHVAAVCVSGIGPCLAACDADDVPLRPAILYGVDTRAGPEVEEMTAAFGADEIFARCGSALSSQALGPKLLWLRRHEPDHWVRLRRWHMASSYVLARLTGRWILDHASASQCDPFYELATSSWNRSWCDRFLPDLELPELVWPGEIVGEVGAQGASSTGLDRGTPVLAGTIDCWAEAASVDVRRSGDLMLQYGSTCFLVLYSDDQASNPSMWTTRGIDAGSLTLAAGTATAGGLTAWLRGLFGDVSFQELTTEAASSPPGANGLLLLPYFAGERTPIFDPQARGTVIGLTQRHTRGDVFRAALEGIAFGLRHILEHLPPASGPNRIVAVGGGTRSPVWLQAVSDVTGLTQEVPHITIGASYGDAKLAAEAVDLGSRARWQVSRLVEPDEKNATLYEERYARYRELHEATRGIQHALARQQSSAPL